MTQEPAAVPSLSGARRRLRILQVVPTYFPAVRYGGPVRSVHALSRTLVELGHDVHVFTSSMDGPYDLDLPSGAPVDLDGVTVHYFPARLLRRICWCPSMKPALERNIRSFDVVHLHSIFLWPTWIAARAARAARVPYLMSPRGMLGREVIRRKSRVMKTAWIRLVERKNLRCAAAMHVTAELERTEVESLQLRLPPIVCIPNGVDCPGAPAPLSAGPCADLRAPYALFLGRIDAKKGLDRLLAAWRSVPDLCLIIAGNDESGYRHGLERFAADHDLTPRVRFVGGISDEHKWALYQNAALFILPSYSENFGNVVAEAMAMGCPVIVTPEVGLADLVRSADAGLVVEGNPGTLADAVRFLMQDVDRRRAMGHHGRAAVREHLSWESIGKRMETEYRRILARPATEGGRVSPRAGRLTRS